MSRFAPSFANSLRRRAAHKVAPSNDLPPTVPAAAFFGRFDAEWATVDFEPRLGTVTLMAVAASLSLLDNGTLEGYHGCRTFHHGWQVARNSKGGSDVRRLIVAMAAVVALPGKR